MFYVIEPLLITCLNFIIIIVNNDLNIDTYWET